MADKTEFLQAIDDAILDADSLERFINGSDSETVLTRLSAKYPTLQKALKELFESGSIAGRFETLAELQASDLVDGDYALVADDEIHQRNGLYVKQSGEWVRSAYNIEPPALTSIAVDNDKYSLFVQGKYHKTPWGITKEGVVEQEVIKTKQINNFKLQESESPFEPDAFAFEGENGLRPLSIRKTGTVYIDKLHVNDLQGVDINGDGGNGGGDKVSSDIKNAIHEWWIYPLHTRITEPYERIISATYSESGEIMACESTPGLGVTKRVVIDKSNGGVIDDHECPAIHAENGRRFVLIWGRSYAGTTTKVYVTDPSGDLDTFLDKPPVTVHTGPVGSGQTSTYQQIIKLPKSTEEDDYFWVFGRHATVGFGFVELKVNQSTGEVTASEWKQLFNNLNYISTADSRMSDNVVRLTTVNHPDTVSTNPMHYLEISKDTGAITMPTMPSFSANMDGTGLPIDLTEDNAVLENIKPSFRRRLFYTRPGPMPPAFLYMEWNSSKAVYKIASLNPDKSWQIREVGDVGDRFGHTYYTGGCFPDPCYSDMFYLSKYDQTTSLSTLDEVRFLQGVKSVKNILTQESSIALRPYCPVNGGGKITYCDVTWYSPTHFEFNSTVKIVNTF